VRATVGVIVELPQMDAILVHLFVREMSAAYPIATRISSRISFGYASKIGLCRAFGKFAHDYLDRDPRAADHRLAHHHPLDRS
jgi:hypothetical protein